MSETSKRSSGKASKISTAEWEVMDVLWNRSPLSAGEVSDHLTRVRDWSPKTVQTLLARLVKKGCLSYEDQGNRYLYSPAVSREESVREESRSFVDRVFGGDEASTLLYFARTVDLSEGEVEELRRLLDRAEAEARTAEGGEEAP